MAAPGQQNLNINQLSLQQLNLLRQDLEEEVQQLAQSLAQVKELIARFLESREALQVTMKAENKGKAMLVPLTSSLYVPGELSNVDTVMVDIGTGYYAEKSIKDAESYFNRKLKLLEENLEKVSHALAVRRQNLMMVGQTMNQKIAMQQHMQRQQAVTH